MMGWLGFILLVTTGIASMLAIAPLMIKLSKRDAPKDQDLQTADQHKHC